MTPIPTQTAVAVVFTAPLAGLGLVGLALVVVFVVGMRTRSPAVQRTIRRTNKAFWNPRSMKTAGTPGAYAAVIHHVGRRSGTSYETPVVPTRTEEGFLIVLPYDTNADWVQNVLAAGRGTIIHEGETHEFDDPEVVLLDSADVTFSQSERMSHRLMRIDHGLRLHTAAASGPGPVTSDSGLDEDADERGDS